MRASEGDLGNAPEDRHMRGAKQLCPVDRHHTVEKLPGVPGLVPGCMALTFPVAGGVRPLSRDSQGAGCRPSLVGEIARFPTSTMLEIKRGRKDHVQALVVNIDLRVEPRMARSGAGVSL